MAVTTIIFDLSAKIEAALECIPAADRPLLLEGMMDDAENLLGDRLKNLCADELLKPNSDVDRARALALASRILDIGIATASA